MLGGKHHIIKTITKEMYPWESTISTQEEYKLDVVLGD